MGPEVVNRNKNCVFNGPYAGRDLCIIMYQDNEREFVVTHNANIKPVSYFTGRETELNELRQRVEEGRKSVLVSGMGGIGKTHICRKLFEEYLNKHAEDEKGPLDRVIGGIPFGNSRYFSRVFLSSTAKSAIFIHSSFPARTTKGTIPTISFRDCLTLTCCR